MARKWIVRQGSKSRGFRYVGPNGQAVSDKAQLERIDKLRIPPAWRDVHVSTDPRSAIQVWVLMVFWLVTKKALVHRCYLIDSKRFNLPRH